MKNRIFYLGFYNCEKILEEKRESFPAADTKINYICSALVESGFKKIHLITASKTRAAKCRNGRIIQLNKNIDLKTFFTVGRANKICKVFDLFFSKFLLLLYLLKNLNSDDTLLVYHSLYYMRIVSIAKRIKGFKLIEEVEEIYSDVSNNKKDKKNEINFFKKADAYIFSTILLEDRINKNFKPSAISNGSYLVEKDRGGSFFSDKKIHVVYAGTADPRKGGALAAVEAALFLDDSYHIHILSFGNNKDISALKKSIELTSLRTKCTITFDGEKTGEEYICFLQSCHIGLSTQNPSGDFNDTSFPSKILVYMANGLKVVSIRIPAIETSDVNQYIFYYDEQKPKSIALAIMSASSKESFDNRSVLNCLNQKFVKDLMGIIENDFCL